VNARAVLVRFAGLHWFALSALSVAGIAVSSYLTYSHYADEATVCAGIGSCAFVQTSEYSEIVGVPVALMGLLYFVAVLSLSTARLAGGAVRMPWAQPAVFSMALGGTALVTYLTYVEVFILEAVCIWCVSVATLTVLTLGVAIWGALAGE